MRRAWNVNPFYGVVLVVDWVSEKKLQVLLGPAKEERMTGHDPVFVLLKPLRSTLTSPTVSRQGVCIVLELAMLVLFVFFSLSLFV